MDLSSLAGRPIHADLRRLADYCAALAEGEGLPHWRDFRPADVKWLLDRLVVIDVLDGGADYYYRLSGSTLPQIFGGQVEGTRLGDSADEIFQKNVKPVYDEVVRTRCPIWHGGALHWRDGGVFHIENILIPFTRDGYAVDVILGGSVCDIPKEELVLFRGTGIGVLQEVQKSSDPKS